MSRLWKVLAEGWWIVAGTSAYKTIYCNTAFASTRRQTYRSHPRESQLRVEPQSHIMQWPLVNQARGMAPEMTSLTVLWPGVPAGESSGWPMLSPLGPRLTSYQWCSADVQSATEQNLSCFRCCSSLHELQQTFSPVRFMAGHTVSTSSPSSSSITVYWSKLLSLWGRAGQLNHQSSITRALSWYHYISSLDDHRWVPHDLTHFNHELLMWLVYILLIHISWVVWVVSVLVMTCVRHPLKPWERYLSLLAYVLSLRSDCDGMTFKVAEKGHRWCMATGLTLQFLLLLLQPHKE